MRRRARHAHRRSRFPQAQERARYQRQALNYTRQLEDTLSYLSSEDWPEDVVAGDDWDIRPAAERAVAMEAHLLRPLVGEGTPSPRAPPIPGVRSPTPPPPVRSL